VWELFFEPIVELQSSHLVSAHMNDVLPSEPAGDDFDQSIDSASSVMVAVLGYEGQRGADKCG
jgi:hypothetical protein